jgi:hypothetical protein
MIIGRILLISSTITEKHKKLNKEEKEPRELLWLSMLGDS